MDEQEKQKRMKVLQDLAEIGEIYQRAMKENEEAQEKYWNSFTPDQQIDLFCSVVRRIFKGEIEEKGSYRHVLYSTFGFGPESYALALDAGYMSIHNAIMDEDHDFNLLERFCKTYNIDDAENKITTFLA